jgi:hypothetical protein
MLLTGIINIAPQYGDTMLEVGSSPNSYVNQLVMCTLETLFDFLVDLGRAVSFAVSDMRIKGSSPIE